MNEYGSLSTTQAAIPNIVGEDDDGSFVEIWFVPIIGELWTGMYYTEYDDAEQALIRQLKMRPHTTRGFIRKIYQVHHRRG